MSLEGLFTDRRARKYIKDSIYEAHEIKDDVCDKCGNHSDYLLEAFNKHLCEKCCESIINDIDEDYDTVFESTDDAYIWEEISEGYTSGDYDKLTQDAAAKNMPVHKYLKSEYGLTVPANLGDTYATDGRIYIPQKDITSGNTKINRFIDDYNVQFTKAKTVNDLVPDADGYLAKIKGGASNGANLPNVPTAQTPSPVKTTTTQTKSSSAKSAKPTTAKGNGFSVSGDESHFVIKISDDISLDCTQTSATTGAYNYDVKIEGTKDSTAYTVKQGSIKEMANELLTYIKQTPCALFTAFDDEFDSSEGYILAEYPSYAFMFDDNSFDGKTVSLVLALNGVPYTNTRVALSKKDVISKAALDGKLLKALNDRLAKFYPVLFDGSMNINTSIGKAVSSLISVDNKNTVKIHTEIGNIGYDWEISGKGLSDKEQAVNSMLYELYSNHMDKIIPDWTKLKNKNKSAINPKFTDCFVVEIIIDNKVDVNLNFSLQDLYDEHAIIFHTSIIDQKTGTEQPKSYIPITYNKPGMKLEDFAILNGNRIYKKYFDKSTMQQTLTVSAQEKIKNKSKKVIFLNHVADVFKKAIKKFSSIKVEDLDLDFEIFDVNDDNKVTNVVFRISDPFNDVAGSSDELEKQLHLGSWVKEIGKSTSPKDLKKYGPSVLYKVIDMEQFSNAINLPVLENAMLEAFGIERVGKKVICLNEAYWVEEDGEFLLKY